MKYILPIILILAGIAFKLIPELQHTGIHPITAIALFAGVYFNKRMAILVPFAIMAIADYFVGYYDILLMASVWTSFILFAMVGRWFRKRKKWILGGAVASSLIYFVITNFAVWQFTVWYPHTLQGLILCYTIGLPYLFKGMISTVLFTGGLFGAYELSKVTYRKLCFS